MSWTIIAHGTASASGAGSVTINTTGADLLIVCIDQYSSAVNASDIVDSKGNTYTAAITRLSTGGPPQGAGIFYCTSPIVGSGHSVHSTSGNFGSIGFVAVSGSVASPLDATISAAISSGTTLAPGSVAPSQSGEFCLAFYSVDTTSAVTFSSVDSGFTILDTIASVSPGFGFALAYLEQTTATAINPVLTVSPTLPNQALAFIATFKAPTAAIPTADPFYVGVNYPWNAFGADFGTGGFGDLTNMALVASDFNTFASQGVKLVRWWLMADGRYCPVFNPDGTTVGLNNRFLIDINQVLAICAATGVSVMFSIMDNLMFNNASNLGSGVIGGGHAAIVTNTILRDSFLNNALKPLLQFVSSNSNKQYVFAWEIVNEPEAQIAGGYNGFDFFTGPAQFDLSVIQAWVQNVTNFIHTWCPGIPVTVGSAIPVWTPLWIGLGLDFYQAHYYQYMDAAGPPGSGLTPVPSITKDDGVTHLDAPCLLGEFASTGGTYGLNDTSVYSARWYMDQALARGYEGAIVWSKNAGDSASNWPAFQPVFTNWVQNVHPDIVGPVVQPPVQPPFQPQPPPRWPSVINKSTQFQKDVVPYITDHTVWRK